MRQKAQVAPEMVIGIIIMLAVVAFGAVIFAEIQTAATSQAEADRVNTTNQLLNVLFTDNTLTLPDDWDNYVENAAVNTYDTSSGYVIITVIDNGDPDSDGVSTTENGVWYQALALTDINDGIVSATVTAQYQLDDNENLEAINSYIYLCDASDNTIVWTDNSVENDASAYTSISVDVTDNIAATGTYTLYLYTEILADNDNVGSNIVVEWTAANLVVVTYSANYGENIVGDVGDMGGDLFPLILLTVLLAVFGAILLVLKMWG